MTSELATAMAELTVAQLRLGAEAKAPETTKLMDYLANQPGHRTAFPESPLAQTLLLTNPSELAGKVGEYADGFHKRTEKVLAKFDEAPERSRPGPADTSATAALAGPASALPRPQPTDKTGDGALLHPASAFDGLFEEAMATAKQHAGFSLEVTLVSKMIGGATGAMHTLLRG